MRWLAAMTALACLAGGCTLIDQRTFQRAGRAPDQPTLARAAMPNLPLLTIRFDGADADLQPLINEAAEAVQSRKPDAEYDVVSPIPTTATPAVQETFQRLGQQDTARVVSALGYAGVSLDRVHVGFRGDAGAPPREVLVYVR